MLLKRILTIVGLFVIGVVGGIFADQILWPYFVEKPLFYQYRLEKAPIYLTETKQVTIEENTALSDAQEKAAKAVVGVKTKTKTGVVVEGSGLVLTADGLLITTADLVPKGSDFYFFVDNEWPKFQVLKTDLKQNLALVKVEKSNLSTVGFADFGKIRLGERLFLLGLAFGKAGQEKFFDSPAAVIDEGIVRALANDILQTDIFEKKSLQGSPLFNVRGEFLGLASIDVEGRVTVIPITAIRAFTGL